MSIDIGFSYPTTDYPKRSSSNSSSKTGDHAPLVVMAGLFIWIVYILINDLIDKYHPTLA